VKVGDLVQDVSDKMGNVGVIVRIALDGSENNSSGNPGIDIYKVRWSDGRLGFFYEEELRILNESR